MRHNQKELAQASNPGVLPFSVDAPETKTDLLGASVCESTFCDVVQSAASSGPKHLFAPRYRRSVIPTRQIGVKYQPSFALARLNSGHAASLRRKRGLPTYVGPQTAVLVLSRANRRSGP